MPDEFAHIKRISILSLADLHLNVRVISFDSIGFICTHFLSVQESRTGEINKAREHGSGYTFESSNMQSRFRSRFMRKKLKLPDDRVSHKRDYYRPDISSRFRDIFCTLRLQLEILVS